MPEQIRSSPSFGFVDSPAPRNDLNDRPGPNTVGIAAGLVLLGLTIWAFIGSPAAQTATEAGVRVDPAGVYNPVLAGEPLPEGFRQLLPRDAIKPIYDPTFLPADQVMWPAGTDVIGVRLGDEAKAYPVSFLNGRELVVDELDGIPILVSW